jgi:AcrR family transcriptional regulator
MNPAPARVATLRDRNKQRLRERIVRSAIALATARGLEHVTADAIAADAEVGRATFFRYFDSKEAAVIVGFYEERLTILVEALGAAPRELGPMDAVLWTFRQLSKRPDRQPKLVRLHARMVTSSPALRAKAYEFQTRYEQAIAGAVAARFPQPRADDPRPRLLAAAALAVVQASIEIWAARGDTPEPTALVLAGLEALKAGFNERAKPSAG